MMYFNDRSDTNIDKEIDDKFDLRDFFQKYKLFIIIGVSLLLLLLLIIILVKRPKIEYFIDLNGKKEVTIYEGSEYIEEGYKAYDNKNNDLTDKVDIDNRIIYDEVGEYEIIYKLYDTIEKRIVSVVEKPKGATYIHLIGDEVIYLKVNEKYVEPGYIVIDTVDSNLTNSVEVYDNIDNKTVGIYKVIYSVTNSSGITSTCSRKVIVMDSDVSISLDNYDYTNKEVGIKIHIIDNYFDYLLLPNNVKVTNKDYVYNVSLNGTYKFVIYNKKGIVKEENVSISNIDREKPNGSCSVKITNDGKMIFNINSSDNNGIAYYLYNNKKYFDNSFTINGSQNTATISIYDKAGNSYEANCNVTVEEKPKSKEVPVKVNVKACFGGEVLEEGMDFTEYILGVLYGEEGFNEKSIDKYPEYVKAFTILVRTYSLRRGGYSSHPDYINIKSCSSDQNWCDIYKGCHRYQTQSMFNSCMKTQTGYGAQKCADRVTTASGVNGSTKNTFSYDGGTVTTDAIRSTWHKKASEETIKKLKEIVNDTAGLIIKQKDGSISKMGYVACKNSSGTNGKFCGDSETIVGLTELNLTALEMLQRFTTEDIKIEYYSD